MVYKSFKNSKQKIEKSWNRSEENKNDLKDIPLITLDFNSINFNKEINTIPIVTNELLSIVSPFPPIVLLENFPEWAINMIEVTCIYTMEDGFTEFPIIEDFQEAHDNGTLKIGDVSIIEQEFDYWFNNIDETNYQLKVFLSAVIRQITKLTGAIGYTSINVPLFLTLSLKILNQRIYETMNEKKE